MLNLNTIYGKFIKYTLLLLIVPPSIFLTSYFYSFRKEVITDAYTDICDEVTNQQTAISGWLTHHEDLLKFVASSPNIVQQPETMLVIFQAFLAAHNDFKSVIFLTNTATSRKPYPPLHLQTLPTENILFARAMAKRPSHPPW